MRLPPARTKAPPVPDAVPAPDDGAPSCDPRAASLVEGFCDALRVERNASAHTVRAYRIDLMDYARWAAREGVDPLAATHRQLRRYLGELDRAQYSRTTVNRRLSALRSFFRWLNVTGDRKSTRLNSSHLKLSRMPSSA